MALPFSTEQFFEVFRAYHALLWPAPLLLNALALVAVLLVFVRHRAAGAAISAILALLWIWSGAAYHLAFFTRINRLAWVFGGVFVLGGLLFLWHGVVRGGLAFRADASARSAIGFVLLAYALLVYPALTTLLGHAWPGLPTFGLPCPTTLFSLGLLALAVPPTPRAPWLVPIAWALVGATAAFLLDVWPDLALLPAALVGWVLLTRRCNLKKV
jgi:Family of unknown function (DUF6064)